MTEQELPEIKLDADNLYREEQITDLRAGSIRRMLPIKADGSDDSSRDVIFEGHASLMTPGGALPLHFLIDVETLAEALDKFPELAKAALEQTLEEMQRLRREQQSQIVVPGQGGAQGGGMPGGGIQMP